MQALTDTPCIVFWKEILAAYPGAKIILTVRDSAEAWHRSQMSTVQPFAAQMWPSHPSLWEKLLAFARPSTPIDRMFKLLLRYHPMFQWGQYDLVHNTSKSKEMYEDWNADIVRTVPRSRLLVMNLKEGWPPLCKFLNVAEPSHSFPNLNDADTWRRINGGTPEKARSASEAVLFRYLVLIGSVVACVPLLLWAWYR